MSTSTRPSVLVVPALALLCLAAGCQGSSAAAEEPVRSSSAAPQAGQAHVNGLAAEQEAEAVARIAAEAEADAVRFAAEAEATRVAAEATAARVAEEQAGQNTAVPRTAVAGGPATPRAAPRNPTGPAPAPAPAVPVDYWVSLSDKSCSFDGVSIYRMKFTVHYSDGRTQRVDDYTSTGPAIGIWYTNFYGGEEEGFNVRPGEEWFDGYGC